MAKAPEMTALKAVEIIDRLEKSRVPIWVDGGWGIDALLKGQTRSHADLDLALDRRSLERAKATLKSLGFKIDRSATPGLPARLVMKDAEGNEVDLHPLVFDKPGDGWQQLSRSDKSWGRYPAEDLKAKGRIGRLTVRCLSPGLQFRFHLGYQHGDRDKHDLQLLVGSFGVGPHALRKSVRLR